MTRRLEPESGDQVMSKETRPSECENCGELSTTVVERDNEYRNCDLCWADALAYGHYHGLHENLVEGCPSCAGHVPDAYKVTR
jgi:hypothetical protein